jgi:WD40 repeat protein
MLTPRRLLVHGFGWVAYFVAFGAAAGADPRPLVELPLDESRTVEITACPAWLEFSPDGHWLTVGYRISRAKARVRIWSRADWKATDWDFDCAAEAWSNQTGCAFDAKGETLYFPAVGQLHALALPVKKPPTATDLPGRMIRPPIEMELVGLHHLVGALKDEQSFAVTTINGSRKEVQVHIGRIARPSELTETFVAKQPSIETAGVSQDGKLVAVGFELLDVGIEEPNQVLEVWGTNPAKKLLRRERLRGPVGVVQFSPDGKTLAAGGGDGSVTLWDVATGRLTRSWIEDYSISSVDFHPTRPLLAYTTRDGKGKPNLRVADVLSGRLLASLRPDRDGSVRARFSPDGKALAVVGWRENVVRVWEVDKLVEK